MTMIVIADTSPINYLVLIDEIDVLPRLFNIVTIPHAVFEELSHPKAPQKVHDFLNTKPAWLNVVKIKFPNDAELNALDPGEREAIYLAETEHADLLIIDERKGFRLAESRNIPVVGTAVVLEMAAKRDLLDLDDAFRKLSMTSFRVSPKVLTEILERFHSR
jgi:predicted nucleic acid-binding protein